LGDDSLRAKSLTAEAVQPSRSLFTQIALTLNKD
jgi:hypothetical protein